MMAIFSKTESQAEPESEVQPPPQSHSLSKSQSQSSLSPRTGLAPIVTTKSPQNVSRNRFSTYSMQSNTSNHVLNPLSRPVSMAFPHFHSSLPYALVRDFAYPPFHLLHYGPSPPELSGASTPASDLPPRRLSDPAPSWDFSRGDWQTKAWDTDPLPKTSYADKDGPPWSEDEDLASPVVTASRHRKNRSSIPAFDDARAHATPNGRSGSGYDYSHPYDPSNPGRMSGPILPHRAFGETRHLDDFSDDEDRRFSRDYQFTIVSPDEEMHGRAVALFDFNAENENELSMKEGMVVFVSFRHGEGWLVAEDLKTGESGLVPETYVRLFRDIEGGYHGLFQSNGDIDEARTPTQESTNFSSNDRKEAQISSYQPVVSTFSISREDLEPIPSHKLNSPSTATPSRKSFEDALNSSASKES